MVKNRSLALLLVLAGALLTGLAWWVAPVGAIETSTYGLDVAGDSEDGRLHLALRAGETTSGRARVWNKTDAPLVLALTIVPARVDGAGKVSLGGDGEGVDWVEVSPARVELAPGAERTVVVRVDAPRKLEADTLVVALQVEPAMSAAGAPPAVLQRLALTTYLEPDEDSLIASLGPFPWIAVGALVVAGAALVRSVLRRRRLGASAAHP